MRKERNKIIIAYLKEDSVEGVYERHILSFCSPNKRKPSMVMLIPKYQYLLHIIITKCKHSDKGKCFLNTDFYRDHIFYDDYNNMLLNLSYLGIISIGCYQVGKHSTEIYLMNWNIGYMTSYNKKFIKWYKVIKEREKNFQKVKKTSFTCKYSDSLRCLNLDKMNEAIAYIDNTIKDKQTHKYQFYKNCIINFNKNELEIYNIDAQKRIYHYLTSLPRSLRIFFNIKYELDISNSHPLLLNFFNKIL